MPHQGSKSCAGRRRAAVALALGAAFLLAAPATAQPRLKRLPALVPVAGDALTRALEAGSVSEARYALERARSLFRLRRVQARFPGTVRPGRHDATLVLRDLTARLHLLRGAERRAAERLLARPTDGGADPAGHGYSLPARFDCRAQLCLHWVDTTADAPPLADADVSGKPDWVETTAAVLEEVWAAEVVRLGYRAPLADRRSGLRPGNPNRKLDVFLADIGDDGLFGYCVSDDPRARETSRYRFYDVSAYCVLDNDFARTQFSGRVFGLDALRVTAAHEFFHAVQFAYDFLEDLWLVEGTAGWIEDEVYDDVDDNVAYLRDASPLSNPRAPLDLGGEGYEYGAWIFWRFLSERFGVGPASDPGVVRAVWRRADGSPTGPDRYSAQAARDVIVARAGTFRGVFGEFAVANRMPHRSYDEGRALAYPRAHGAAFVLSRLRPTTGWRLRRPAHLSSRYVSFLPGRGAGNGAVLAVAVDLPPWRAGPEATVLVVGTSGNVGVRRLGLDRRGDAWLRVPFARTRVRRVHLVLTNASRRFSCWEGTSLSCAGVARDDGRPYRFRARLR